MNSFNGIGRLVRDIDVNTMNSGVQVARFTVAIDRPYKDKNGDNPADFIRCEKWGFNGRNGVNNNVIDLMTNSFHKGSKIGIYGELRTGSYTNKDGDKRYTWGVRVDDFDFLDPKPSNSGNVNRGYNSKPAKPKQPTKTNVDGMDVADDDLPF